MFTLGYRFRPWSGDRGAGRRPVDPRLRPRHRAGVRRRRSTSATTTGSSRPSGTARPPAGRSTVETRRRREAADLRVPVVVHRLLRLRARATRPSCPASRTSPATSSTRSTGPRTSTTQASGSWSSARGATAVTLVPALAETAAHVTMLQRSPTYILSVPARTGLAARLGKVLPPRAAYAATRWKNILVSQRALPAQPQPPRPGAPAHPQGDRRARCPASTSTPTSTRATTRGTSGCAWCPTATCSGRSGTARRTWSPTPSRRSPPTGVRLASGGELEADVVVTATGLKLKPFGGIELRRRRRRR